MKKLLVPLICINVLYSSFASEWYRSNPGGLALESISHVKAMRETYALEVIELDPSGTPEVLQKLEPGLHRVLAERLYHENKIIMHRYKLYNSQNTIIAASQFAEDGYSWIERYDTKQRIIEEFCKINSSIWFRRTYSFLKEKIAEARTYTGEPGEEGNLLYIDVYRYDRTGFLRFVERQLTDGSTEGARTAWFTRSVVPFTSMNRPGPGSTGLPNDTKTVKGLSIVYSLDAMGRVVREQHKDNDGNLVYDKTNTWEKERLSSVVITEQGKTTRIEYSFDGKGNRTGEKYYSDSELVRQIFIDGNKETEELYDKGQLILRTLWMDGVKQSEQRPRRPVIRP